MHRFLTTAHALPLVILSLSLFAPDNSHSQTPIGIFADHTDVGAVGSAGSASYDEATGEYRITASGTNMWFDNDQFHFVWNRIEGDFILTAMGGLEGEGVDPHRKFGWMVRSSLDDSSRYVDIAIHGDGLASMQFRRGDGDDTEQVQSRVRNADVIQLSRRGGVYTASVARSGDVLTSDHIADLALGNEVYVGLFVCAHNNDVLETAVLRNVSITIPAAEDFIPYRDYIGGNLEILDVETGRREALMRSPHPIQAPNWTLDGKSLIYNDSGLLYRFDLETRETEVINTGFANRNNNDHVLSFDGGQIGISHHSTEHEGQSLIYRLPVSGGEPVQVTEAGPSYLHGWSPDGSMMTFTGGRDDIYNIYVIPVEGGQEIQLTETPGLDDGSEYSPDGKFIYFNSTRSGRMKLWRMAPDGSNPEQLTFDEMNDWFPHVSPDGKWIAFLSYEKDVEPGDHPFYKQVYLRLLPVDRPEGVRARVIAYVYGGQGTINVPSWSPDSRKVGFVSNSLIRNQKSESRN
ncbi:MAG TPA: biopolymer transporter TolR [Rhodothermales bacterium]